MKKVHITRKNWIAISMVFLYCLLFVCIAGCLDAKNSIFSSKNPIHMMAESLFGSKNMINAEFNAWIMIYLFAIYAFVFALPEPFPVINSCIRYIGCICIGFQIGRPSALILAIASSISVGQLFPVSGM